MPADLRLRDGRIGVELNWLEDFLCLARTNSFSRAAEERNITQSAFSRRIKALEHWLGAPLVDRSTYPTSLTPAGRQFLATAEQVLRQLQQTRDDLRSRHGRESGRIRFAALHSLSLGFFPRWFGAIERSVPNLTTALTADNMHNCVQALIEGDVDFLICFVHPKIPVVIDPLRFPCLTLGQDRLVPVTASNGNGTPRFELPGTRNRPLPYLTYGPDAFLGRAVELVIREQPRCHLTPVYENAMAEGLKAMVLDGHGIAWLPQVVVEEPLAEGQVVRAGPAGWDVPLEVRLYRAPEPVRREVAAVWTAAEAQADRRP